MAQNNLFNKEPSKPTPIFSGGTPSSVSSNFAWNKAQEDALIEGNPNKLESMYTTYLRDGTVRSEAVETFIDLYNQKELEDTGVLDQIRELPMNEQIERIEHEIKRLDASKLSAKQALTLQMMKRGFGNTPVSLRDEVFRTMDTKEIEALRSGMVEAQRERLQQELDATVAPLGEDFTTLEGVKQAVQQEFIPFVSIATRVATARAFTPKEAEGIAKYWPGEIRQDIREWFAEASTEERVQYIKDIAQEVEKLRKGPQSRLFTEYGILEQYMGIFSEELLNNNTPKNTWDRVLGNLDLLLESVYGVGVLAKVGGRSVKSVFRANNSSSLRQAAHQTNNQEALEAFDNNIREVADRLGITIEEASAVDLPRPPSFKDDMDVLPDSVKKVIDDVQTHIRPRVLVNTDPLTGLGLSARDKAIAVRNEIAAIDKADNVHVNHKMMTVESLPNDTGVRITAVLGRTPGAGWDDFNDLADDLIELDPKLETYEIVRRNKKGKLETVDMSQQELLDFVFKGRVPVSVEQSLDPASASTRLFEGRKLSTVSSEDLTFWLSQLDSKSADYKNIKRELDRRQAGLPVGKEPLISFDGGEFYLRLTQDRFWHTTDKLFFEQGTVQNTGILPRGLVSPNARFSSDIYESFSLAYHKEQALRGVFNTIYKPFYSLSVDDKKVVENVFEWAEDFAKLQAEAGNARAPTYTELLAEFDGLTEAQLRGYAAVREGLNLQWELFNRRLYRDFHKRGLKTARPVNPERPRYHGVPIERESINKSSGVFFDPELNEVKKISKQEIDDIYDTGGTIIKLDFPLAAKKGGRADRVIVRHGHYELGALSRRPLEYYEGYVMRFYDDPYYIVKQTANPTINGNVIKDHVLEEAIRTAGTAAEAQKFVRNLMKNEDIAEGVSFEVKKARDIDNVEGTLFQQEALAREGRLFWDKRDFERLPDVNGNKAKVNDLVQALEKGTALALRQTTQEDLMSTLRGAFGREYSNLLPPRVLATDNIKTVIDRLRTLRRGTADLDKKKQINEAIALAKYFRIQLGADSRTVPYIREGLISVAAWVGRMGVWWDSNTLKSASRSLEGYFQTFDPYRSMRSVSFHVFMVLRPVRQFALQSMQVSYLSPIDPAYVASGKIFKDALALRRGVHRLRKSNYSDGMKDSAWAKTMGLSNKEYKRLVEEFERSGLLETVDVHSHAGGAPRSKRIPLPKETSLSRAAYRGRQFSNTVLELAQKGFDLGEQNNLTFTYMIALRRMMKKKGVKSLTELTRKDFDALTIDASNLALAMIKPNKFGYQSGYAGVFTQFLSFSHKAMLGVLGKNPSISKPEAFKIALGTYMLWGANMFGGEDWIREQLARIGAGELADEDIGNGMTLKDVLSAGLVESGFNSLMRATNEEWGDLDLGFLAPGVNLFQIYEKVYENILDQPEKAILGPFYNPASGFLKGAEFFNTMVKGDPDMPAADKFMLTADVMLKNILPAYNDAVQAMHAHTLGVWKTKSGDVLPVQPVWNTILARGLVGGRSEEELTIYRMKDKVWESEENIRNAVEVNQRFLTELFNGWNNGEYDDKYIYQKVKVLSNLYEYWPEGARYEILRRSMTEPVRDGKNFVQLFAELAAKGGAGYDLVPWIKSHPNLDPTQKQNLLRLNEEVFHGKKESEKQILNLIRDESE